jgi:hypothetical protein
MKALEESETIVATVADERINGPLELAVNRGITYANLIGNEEGRKLMNNAGVPHEVIDRIFQESSIRRPT